MKPRYTTQRELRRIPMAKLTMVCPKCGSHSVTIDAVASWNDETQDWELAGTQDTLTCQDCDQEGYQEEFECEAADTA